MTVRRQFLRAMLIAGFQLGYPCRSELADPILFFKCRTQRDYTRPGPVFPEPLHIRADAEGRPSAYVVLWQSDIERGRLCVRGAPYVAGPRGEITRYIASRV
jgi:hypothetical protein